MSRQQVYHQSLKRGLKRTADSTSEPIEVWEAKQHLRVRHSDDDTYISSLITAARNMAESYTNRSFFTQTWVMALAYFPNECIELKRGVTASITTLKYYDTANSLTTWDAANYRLDNSDEIAIIQPDVSWPTGVYDRSDAVEITYVTGWATTAEIPEGIKSAVKFIVGHLYENRQDVIVGSQVNQVPMTSRYSLDPYVIRHYATV
jgi:uncharacterized phiE125 gp8 family phage protein